ncbi:myb-related protein Myb4-like [Hordeum vulgare]|uniref:Uncharacterized protein n=1 Tax=Hordeum vulgare subsp. vulgare TaxID=112509 RepID=A0A8I6WWA2_HORVV|nr:transcription factor MYB17-like [Hordeum vulgare subsp. vulgare]KAE8785098.1 myb-related protein Myb4-like [Hordeum vulgare]KAI5013993.1 hypothetical protein ZWY2020_055383 [Hordeum vulgare]
MGRTPCCESRQGLKKGPWTPEEDKLLVDYVQANAPGNWRMLPKLAGLNRCGKSCRLRWTNYLRPDIKRGPFTPEEHKSILQLHAIVGNKWSMIAAQLPGRTDNEIKNYWNTNLKKQLRQAALVGEQHPAVASAGASAGAGCLAARHTAQWETARLEAEARLSMLSTSAATTSVTASSSSSTAAASAEHGADAPSDVFLRLWNSEVGDTFRRKSAAREGSAPREGALPAPAPLPPPGDDSSAASNVTTAVTAEEYQVFLDMAAEELGLFHGGGYSLYPPADGLFAEFQ